MRLLFFAILFFPVTFFAQKIVVSNPVSNVLYLEVPNPIDVVVEGLKCSNLKIKVDNGSIRGENCKYVINPERTGTLKISVYNKDKLIGENIIPVVNLTLKAILKGSHNADGKLIIERLRSLSVEVEQVNLDIDNYEMEYDVMIIKGYDVIYKSSFSGKHFNNELKNEFSKIVENDIILFTNIRLKINDDLYELNDIVVKK